MKKKQRMHKCMMILLMIAGVFCFAYFVMLLNRVGAHTFFFVFPVIAFGCFGLMFAIDRQFKGKWKIPGKWILAFRILVGTGCLVFAVLLGVILHGQSVGPEPEADYIVVLGAGLRGDRPSLVLQYRINAAAEYLQKNPDTTAIVSGGQGPDEWISEAEAMRRGLEAKGISGDRIILEDASTSTEENLTYSKKLMEDDVSVVIVTNKFHVYRALHIAGECGYTDVSGLGADNVSWLNPTNYLRECLAVVKDVVLP